MSGDDQRTWPTWAKTTEAERLKAVETIAQTIQAQQEYYETEKQAVLREAALQDVITETRFTYTHVCKNCFNAETCPPHLNPYDHLMDFLARHGACHLKITP